MKSQQNLVKKDAKKLGFSKIVELESDAQGLLFTKNEYLNLCNRFSKVIQNDGKIFTLHSTVNRPILSHQRLMLHRFNKFVPDFSDHLEDISSILYSMRQVKDESEIECLRKAVAITIKAQIAAAKAIEDGKTERKIRGAVDGTILAESRPGFYTIMPSRGNTIILHCPPGDRIMNNGELVITDMGAESPHPDPYYSADLTKTWPVSGKFSVEQREIYSIVFKALKHVESHVRPGYWFNNGEDESKSLFHITKKFFAGYGLDKFFPHGVGHHIGLDVHEDCVSNPETYRNNPLREGNIVALEPGFYLHREALKARFEQEFEEGFGVRIESNYLVTTDLPTRLDKELLRKADEIERLMLKLRE